MERGQHGTDSNDEESSDVTDECLFVSIDDLRTNRVDAPNSPNHSELVGASIRIIQERFLMTLEFGARLPSRIEDENDPFVLGFGFRAGEENRSMFAMLDDQGWAAFLDDGSGNKRIDSALTVKGRRVSFDIPLHLAQLNGQFRWLARSGFAPRTPGVVSLAGNRGADRIPRVGSEPFPTC